MSTYAFSTKQNKTKHMARNIMQNLLSHKASSDPSKAGEVAHVYTIPYIVGVSPPHAPQYGNKASPQTMAGIELFMPILQASSKNMQMVFDKNNGLSLGAVVDASNVKKGSSATSYIVDPDENISPLGVSLKWNNVNMKSSIVRGMPYGTMRYGKDAKPTILAGNRPVSILRDSDDDKSSTSSSNKIMCGSTTGKPIVQDPNHMVPISHDGKAHEYSVKRELIIQFADSDFTWVVFFSKPVEVLCHSEAMASVSVPGGDSEVQFRLNVVEVNDEGTTTQDEDELVVRVALLDECSTGKAIIKEHCTQLKTLGYDTVSRKEKSKQYLQVLREGAMLYPKSPEVGTIFPTEDEEDNGSDRVSTVVFDWDASSVNQKGDTHTVSEKKAAASIVAGSYGLRAAAELIETPLKTKKEENSLIMFALPHHLESLSTNADLEADDSLCLRTFHGRTCLVQGSQWSLSVSHGKPQSFLADRPPVADLIPSIAKALEKDIHFKISPNVKRGAADTYFPVSNTAIHLCLI